MEAASIGPAKGSWPKPDGWPTDTSSWATGEGEAQALGVGTVSSFGSANTAEPNDCAETHTFNTDSLDEVFIFIPSFGLISI